MADLEDNLLVTGGAGFIGSCFVRNRLQTKGGRIVVLDKLTYAATRMSLPSSHPRLHFIQGDVADRELVSSLMTRHDVRACVHFAADTHVDRSIESPESFLQDNVVATCRLLEAVLAHWRQLPDSVRGAFRLLQVSTDEVYGSLGEEGQFTEHSPYAPTSPYSASKAAADHFANAFFSTYGLPVLTTHCSNNFGPFQFPEKLIPLMILNAVEGRPLPVYGDGQQVRDWLHVEDHVCAIELVLSQGTPGESYNIGGDCERRNLDLVRSLCRAVDKLRPNLHDAPCESLIEHVADRPGHDRRYAIDTTKIREHLGWPGAAAQESRLEETVRWYLEHPEWIESTGAAHRVRRGLND